MAPGKNEASTKPRKKPGREMKIGDVREVQKRKKNEETTKEKTVKEDERVTRASLKLCVKPVATEIAPQMTIQVGRKIEGRPVY